MKDENRNIGIKIQEIKELSFSNKIGDELIENFDDEKVGAKLGIAVRGDSEKHTISVSILLRYQYRLEDKTKEFLKLETDTTFGILNFGDEDIKYNSQKNEVFINDGLMMTFLNTAIGATRGMLAYKMASLPINLVLPLFDMKQLMNPKQKSKSI